MHIVLFGATEVGYMIAACMYLEYDIDTLIWPEQLLTRDIFRIDKALGLGDTVNATVV